jgi:hypothetical protein
VTLPSIYTAKLQKYASTTEGDVNMALPSRIDFRNVRNDPDENLTKNGNENLFHPDGVVDFPAFPLLVLDVYIPFPKPVLKSRSTLLSEQAEEEKLDAKAQSIRRQLSEKKQQEAIFPVALHQNLGLFSLENDRPPPNLDTGLFNWMHFHRFVNRNIPQTAVGDGITRSKGAQKENKVLQLIN